MNTLSRNHSGAFRPDLSTEFVPSANSRPPTDRLLPTSSERSRMLPLGLLCWSASVVCRAHDVTFNLQRTLLENAQGCRVRIAAMAQRLLFYVVVLVLCGACSGCESREMKGRLVVIPHRISGLLWLSEHVGISESAERHHFDLIWRGPIDEGSLDEQSELADRAIREGAAGIILSPNVYQVFKRELVIAQEHHIPVVLEGEAAGIEPMAGVSFVLGNQEATGVLIAERLAKMIGNHGEVILVGLDPRTPGNVERSDAIVAAIQKLEPGIRVSERVFGSSSPAHSEVLILQALAAHPEVRALVSLSAGDSVAAASALHASGKLGPTIIIGCDQSQAAFMLLHMGVLDSLVIQDNRRQGSLAVDAISDMRAGRYGSRTIYVDPTLVTRDNINSEPVQQLLLMHR